MGPSEEGPKSEIRGPKEGRKPKAETEGAGSEGRAAGAAFAYIPFGYISDARQRIEVYRKLAQVTDKAGVEQLERELRDRFGPVPAPLGLLLQVAELKVLGSERGVTEIEVKEDKLMLTRNNDYVMVRNMFPRLTKKQAGARLKEIKKLLLALTNDQDTDV
jgi:transcription-repair coupling factor (superfamily II helicase)